MTKLPVSLEKYIVCQYQECEAIHVEYIMRWHGYKVFKVKRLFYDKAYMLPDFLLYKNGKVYKATTENYQEIIYYSIISSNNKKAQYSGFLKEKLNKSTGKTMTAISNVNPPDVPPVLYKYLYKKVIKEKDIRITYIADWNNQHIYWVYWPKYNNLNPLTIILYDGKRIKMPNPEEYTQIKEIYGKKINEIINQKAKHNMNLYFKSNL